MTSLKMFRSGVISSLATICQPHGVRFVLRAPLVSTVGLVHHKSSNVDALDIFTTQFLSKERPNVSSSIGAKDRGEAFEKVSTDGSTKSDSGKISNVESWTQSEIDKCLVVSMDCGDRDTFKKIIIQLIALKRLPSDAVILPMLCYLCDDSDDSMATISSVIDVCQETNIAFYSKNMQFLPFLSQYLWKLERFDDALNTLNTIFATTNPAEKSHILRNYRQIIYDGIKNHDEIVVEKILANAERINVKYKHVHLQIHQYLSLYLAEIWFVHRRKSP